MSQQINLFNPIFLRKEKYFSALTMAQSLAAVVLGMALFYGYAAYRTDLLAAEAAQMARRVAHEEARFNAAAAQLAPRQKSPALESEMAAAEAQLKARREAMQALAGGKLGNTSGFSEYLRALARQIVSGLWLTGFSIDGGSGEMTLSGRTLQPELVPAYIRRLAEEPAMRGKSFAMLEMRQPGAAPGKAVPPGAAAPGKEPAAYLEFSLRSREAEAGK